MIGVSDLQMTSQMTSAHAAKYDVFFSPIMNYIFTNRHSTNQSMFIVIRTYNSQVRRYVFVDRKHKHL